MTEIEVENLILLSQNYTHICVGIRIIYDINEQLNDIILWNADRKKLKSGLYGKIYEANIWLDRFLSEGNIKISDLPIIDSELEANWSPDLPLNDIKMINRILNLKAFW